MILQNFRKAAKGYGTYCPIENELKVRKGGKTYRFRCENYVLYFTAPGKPETTILMAPDTTVAELMRFIAGQLASPEENEMFTKNHRRPRAPMTIRA